MFEQSLIGESPKFKSVLEAATKVAALDTTVLITGESGTGKEMLSQFIHSQSLRKNNPFIAINMSAIPEQLMENELFGHAKGAYTGADDDGIGKIQLANGGTLFLDEIGDLSLPLQAKLLRFMQERSFEPLGSNETVYVDVRIISATSKNPYNLLRDGLLREDLYYRLNVVSLQMPALRDRDVDKLLIAKHFLAQMSSKLNKHISGFDQEVQNLISCHNWPGNIRQLHNVIESAVVMSSDQTIHISDLDKNLVDSFFGQNEIIPLKDAIDNFKRDYIIKALSCNKWSQKKTAQVLQIERTYLNRLIKVLKITKSN